jgi:peptidoglycan/xylan/chitin deacetylase (PgdA/CDA1 family)
LTFDDNWKGQYLYVKPILEKYGFKATFFVVCNWVGSQHPALLGMTWENIKLLQKAGHDIQSHSMNHLDLTKLSQKELEYEVRQSKQCLRDHNINSTIFANPFSSGWNNSTVINTVARYYDLDRSGYDQLTYLKCDGWQDISNQTDCKTYFNNGSLTMQIDSHLERGIITTMIDDMNTMLLKSYLNSLLKFKCKLSITIEG